MSKTVISKPIFEFLVKHLVDTEEEKELIIDKYYTDSAEERESFVFLINDYIKKTEGYISNAKIVSDIPNICPFVIIGSIVEVEDIQLKEIEKFHIVSPFYNNIDAKQECASFLSPIGLALLFKKVNEKATVSTPGGSLVYKIVSIELPYDIMKDIN